MLCQVFYLLCFLRIIFCFHFIEFLPYALLQLFCIFLWLEEALDFRLFLYILFQLLDIENTLQLFSELFLPILLAVRFVKIPFYSTKTGLLIVNLILIFLMLSIPFGRDSKILA